MLEVVVEVGKVVIRGCREALDVGAKAPACEARPVSVEVADGVARGVEVMAGGGAHLTCFKFLKTGAPFGEEVLLSGLSEGEVFWEGVWERVSEPVGCFSCERLAEGAGVLWREGVCCVLWAAGPVDLIPAVPVDDGEKLSEASAEDALGSGLGGGPEGGGSAVEELMGAPFGAVVGIVDGEWGVEGEREVFVFCEDAIDPGGLSEGALGPDVCFGL